MSCTIFQFWSNSSGILSGFYVNCGDKTVINISLSGASNTPLLTAGVTTDVPSNYGSGSSLYYSGSAVTIRPNILLYSGSYSATTLPLGGEVNPWVVVPWGLFTLSNVVSALSGISGFPYPVS